MAISDRNLSAGTKLWANYKGKIYHAEVVEVDGATRYKVLEFDLAQPFKSPSAAGSAIFGIDSKGKPRTCNGWAFWTVGEPTAKTEKAPRTPRSSKPKPEGADESADPAPTLPIITTLDDRFECGECGETFATRKQATKHIGEKHPVLVAA